MTYLLRKLIQDLNSSNECNNKTRLTFASDVSLEVKDVKLTEKIVSLAG